MACSILALPRASIRERGGTTRLFGTPQRFQISNLVLRRNVLSHCIAERSTGRLRYQTLTGRARYHTFNVTICRQFTGCCRMASSSTRCSACLKEGEASELTQTRPRTADKIRTFLDDDDNTGISDKFPALQQQSDDDGGTTNTLVLCQRADCLLELYKKHEHSQTVKRVEGNENKRKLGRGPAWTPAPEPPTKERRFDQLATSPEAVGALLENISITGRVLDMCGGEEDAIAERLRGTCDVVRSDATSK